MSSEKLVEPGTSFGTKVQLSVMMFLQFFIWGAWLPLIFGYLGNDGLKFETWQQSLILNAFAIASFVGMFFSNEFADRTFSAEKFLAVSHLVAGLAILGLGWVTDFWTFFALMLVHCLFYVPTISITNSIAFANIKDPQHEFGPVRLWGTIGWIAASWPFVFILVDWAKVPALAETRFDTWLGYVFATPLSGAPLNEGIQWTYKTAGIASILLAAWSLILPHTPPKQAKPGESRFAWMESLKLLALPYVLVLFVLTFIDAGVHQGYFVFTGGYLATIGVAPNWIMPVMSVGQIAEIGTMAVLGYALKSLGWRWIMAIGILGHAIRFGVFALVPMTVPAIVVIMLHGVCYAFFFATVYIFVDEYLPKNARSSAQGLFNFMILGLGPFVANNVWPMLAEQSALVDVKAETKYVAAAANVEIKGIVRAQPAETKTIAVTLVPKTGTEIKRDAALGVDGKIDATFEGVAAGEYTLRIDVQRPSMLLGPKAQAVSSGLKIETKAPEKNEPAHISAYNYEAFFLLPAGTALAAAIGLLLFFYPPEKPKEEEPTEMGPVVPSH